MWGVVTFVLLFCPLSSLVQQTQQPAQEPPPQQPQPQLPPYAVKVDVVAVTPIHGLGLPRLKVPANVQIFTARQISSATADLPNVLAERAASVHVSEAQGGTFQPDLLFRGFAGSPLLGASEGLAVYQNGVRINEPFGDTINWDALPTGAIASVNVMPGSNPLFGLNALGGALSIGTKDGFGFPGHRVSGTTGAFGRYQVQAEAGGHGSSFGYFVAGSLMDERGWRDHSPSTLRRVFGDLAWRGTDANLNVNVTTASNDLTGNGAAPVRLLSGDRAAVFTHPDRTGNDLALVTLTGQRRASTRTLFDAVGYYRHSRIGTFNGDVADDEDEREALAPGDDREGEDFDAINTMSRTRGSAAGVTAQVTRAAPLAGRENHLIIGAGMDAAGNAFDLSTELAQLTPDRGTIGSGLFEPAGFVNLHTRTATASAFFTNTWSATGKLAVTGSARVNWTSVRLRDQIGTALSGDHRFRRINPAAGVTYQLLPGLNVYGSYTQSSRVPTPVELTCADPEDPCRLPNAFVSDPPLNQIVASTWEAGTRGAAGRANWSVSAYSTQASDDIIFVSSGRLRGEGHFENVERTLRRGLEASVDYAAGERLAAFGAYTFQRAAFGSDLRIPSQFHPLAEGAEIVVEPGHRLPGIPVHSAKFGLAAFVTAGLNLGVKVRAQSGQYLRGDEANLLDQLPGFAVVSVHARQRIGRRVAVFVDVQNLLQAEYYTFGVLGDAGLLGRAFAGEPRFFSPGAPRAAWIGLEVRL